MKTQLSQTCAQARDPTAEETAANVTQHAERFRYIASVLQLTSFPSSVAMGLPLNLERTGIRYDSGLDWDYVFGRRKRGRSRAPVRSFYSIFWSTAHESAKRGQNESGGPRGNGGMQRRRQSILEKTSMKEAKEGTSTMRRTIRSGKK